MAEHEHEPIFGVSIAGIGGTGPLWVCRLCRCVYLPPPPKGPTHRRDDLLEDVHPPEADDR